MKQQNIDNSTTITESKYRKYSFTEDCKIDGEILKIQDKHCIFIKNELYDMFQYFLNYLRDKQVKFVVFPLDLYSEVTGEILRNADGVAFMMDETPDIWNICVPQYIKDRCDLIVFGHEIAHIVLNHSVRQEKGASYDVVNYKYEYEADRWSYETLHNFGYLSLEGKLKLIEISQLNFMVNTKSITKAVYKKITSSPRFKKYNRIDKGLLSDDLAGLISDGITCKSILAMIPKMIEGKYNK